eukprot:jgi/Botrbrau1/817/Bobra.0352s0014.1
MANLSKWGICNDEDSIILSVSSKAAEPGATKVRPPKKRFEVWQPDCGAGVITYGLRTANDGKLIGRLASKSLGEHGKMVLFQKCNFGMWQTDILCCSCDSGESS